MAEPHLIARNSAGTVVFDSRTAMAGVCVGLLEIPANTAQTYTYPGYPGATAKVAGAAGVRAWGLTIDYALGYPRLVFASAPALRACIVFVQ